MDAGEDDGEETGGEDVDDGEDVTVVDQMDGDDEGEDIGDHVDGDDEFMEELAEFDGVVEDVGNAGKG